MLTAFWDSWGLAYTKFGSDVHKEQQNITQDIYFNTLMHLRNAIWSMKWGLLVQKVILIHDNAHPHRVRLIQTLLKDFCWEQFEHPSYLLDLVPNDYHVFSQFKKELGGEYFQTREELISAVMNILGMLILLFFSYRYIPIF